MTTRVVTKIGDVFQTQNGRILQLVAIDSIQLNSDVVAIYKPTDDFTLEKLPAMPMDFYYHTTVSAGIKQGLWSKIGKAPVPDVSKLLFKQYFDQDAVEILWENETPDPTIKHIVSAPYWTVWSPVDKDWTYVTEVAGKRLQAEDSSITPPINIIHRINRLQDIQ